MNLIFEKPRAELLPAFERFRNGFSDTEVDLWRAGTPWALAKTDLPAFLDWLTRLAEGRAKPDMVLTDAYWVFSDDEMVGEVNVRHHLRGTLLHDGGHVGYAVQPKFRRRGIATAMLRFACEQLRELGEVEALLTCRDDNIASIGVIEKCGGVRIHDAIVEGGHMRRYLIPLI